MASSLKIFVFQIDSIRFGVTIDEVVQVARPRALSPLKKPPKNIIGTFGLREKPVPVFDLPAHFGLKRKTQAFSIIISDIRGVPVGFLADELSGVASVPADLPVLDQQVFKTKEPVRIAHLQRDVVQVVSFKNLIAAPTLAALKRLKSDS